MSVRPATAAPAAPSTELLRHRPGAANIPNPISLTEPTLPEIPGALAGFTAASIPQHLPVDLEAFRTKVQTASELGLVQEVNNSSNKGLYFRSSANGSAAAKAAGSYLTNMGKVIGGVNDVIRQSELIGAKYATADFEVAVKRYTAQVNGVVDRYEANADAFVQAQNIIYQADVTAIKLQDLGLEKAISLESGFITDVRKTESQAFISEVNRLEGIASREVGARSQIRISEKKQLGTQGYTLYEHTRNNEARAYEATTISTAEYQTAEILNEAKIKAAESAAEERRTGAIKVSSARLQASKDTTTEKGIQQTSKNATETTVFINESAATEDTIHAKYDALTAASNTVSAGEIDKITRVTASMVANKTAEYAAAGVVLTNKTNARIGATAKSVATRISMNPARIAAAVDGYKINVQARIDAAKIEAKAQKDVIPILTAAVSAVALENAKWAEKVFEKRLEQIKDVNEISFAAEKETAKNESAANVDSIKLIGEAEATAAKDRAAASTAAATTRNDATLDAIGKINKNMKDMTTAKMSLLQKLEEQDFATTEKVEKNLNDAKINIAKAQSQAALDNQATKDSFDLDTLKGINQARLEGQAGVVAAQIAFKEKETTARIKAAGVIATASAYATGLASDAAVYATIRSNESSRIVQTNSAIATAHGQASGVRAAIRSTQSAIATNYFIADSTQTTRIDTTTFIEKK